MRRRQDQPFLVGVGYELDSAAKTGVVITEGMPEVKTMEGVYFL